MRDVLPDSRLREAKGLVRGPHPLTTRLNWVPIFCANCGADGGYVPEEHCTFAFYLCLAPKTQVRVRGGWGAIEELSVGDEVLSHRGRWRKIIAVHDSWRAGRNVYAVRAIGELDALVATEGHPFLVLRRETVTEYPNGPVRWGDIDTNQVKPKWVPIEEVHLGDYVCYPVDVEEIENKELTKQTSTILGYYAAEGHVQLYHYKPKTDKPSKTGSGVAVRWTFHSKETELVDELYEALVSYGYRKPRIYQAKAPQNAIYVVCQQRELVDLCTRNVGKGSATKVLSAAILQAPLHWQLSFLGAYLNGDGSQDADGSLRFATASKIMAHQLQAIILRQGIWCHLHLEVRPVHAAIYGRIGAQDTGIFARVSKFAEASVAHRYERCKLFGHVLYRPIVHLSKVEEPPERFINLTIDKDESFVAGLAAVHNCNPCAEKYGNIEGTYMEPDEEFWKKVNNRR